MRLPEADTVHDVGSTRVHSALLERSRKRGEDRISEAEMTRPQSVYADDYRARAVMSQWRIGAYIFAAAATGREHPWLWPVATAIQGLHRHVGSQAVQDSDLWLWLHGCAKHRPIRPTWRVENHQKWFKSNRNHNWKNRFKSDQNSHF